MHLGSDVISVLIWRVWHKHCLLFFILPVDFGHIFSYQGTCGLIPGWSVWDLWWTEWHWDSFYSEHVTFPHSVSFHACSTPHISVMYQECHILSSWHIVKWNTSLSLCI